MYACRRGRQAGWLAYVEKKRKEKKRSIDGFISSPPAGPRYGSRYGYGKSRGSFPLACLLASLLAGSMHLFCAFIPTGLANRRLVNRRLVLRKLKANPHHHSTMGRIIRETRNKTWCVVQAPRPPPLASFGRAIYNCILL